MKKIERRFLLSGVPKDLEKRAYNVISIKQAYLPGNTVVERFSRRKYIKNPYLPAGKKTYGRTIKIGHGVERLEYEDVCSKSLFKTMWGSPHTTLIHKVSHYVVQNIQTLPYLRGSYVNFVWGVDVFKDRDLMLAEIEILNKECPIRIPDWLEKFVVREVTDDIAFEGASLSLH